MMMEASTTSYVKMRIYVVENISRGNFNSMPQKFTHLKQTQKPILNNQTLLMQAALHPLVLVVASSIEAGMMVAAIRRHPVQSMMRKCGCAALMTFSSRFMKLINIKPVDKRMAMALRVRQAPRTPGPRRL